MKKSLKKLELKKEKVKVLTNKEKSELNGALFNSRVLCFASNADQCTAHSGCNGGGRHGLVIACFD